MRVPKLRSAASRTPARLPGLTFGSVSSLLSVALWAAFWILALLTLATLILFIVMAFVPMGPMGLTATGEDGGTSVPVPRAYILFGIGLRSVRSSTATTITLLEPVFATILAVIIVGERLSVVNPGSVGQSRQHERPPRARAAVLDLERRRVTALAVRYDVRAVRADLRRAGLEPAMVHSPPSLAHTARREVRRLSARARSR